jgi:hypothetical protein
MGRIFSRLNRGAFIYTPFIRLMRDHGERFFWTGDQGEHFFWTVHLFWTAPIYIDTNFHLR